MFKKLIPLLLITILFIASFGFYLIYHQHQKGSDAQRVQKGALSTSINPDYLIILVGDSMTEYLGNGSELRGYLAEDYPGKTFDIYNYGFGSTNILSLPERLTQTTTYGRSFKPILDYEAKLIIIESFGYNPLSKLSLNEGLEKQNQILDESIKLIKDKRPNTKIVFLATIAPNKQKYAKSVVLSQEKRRESVEERISYIKNHIKYANDHGIPVINVFEKSLLSGDGNLEYIENENYIHPSPKGVVLIQKQIADFISENQLLN